MFWYHADTQAKKIREYLKQHPCLDYSAKLLLEETAKMLEKEANDNEPDIDIDDGA